MAAATDVDCIVIGAGVVGLAIARALALRGQEVVVLEALDAVGSVTSSRNSEVIHAGIYYPPGSLKGRLCVRGKHLLYDYLEAHQVPHRRCGKWLVACNDAEIAQLQEVVRKAEANGCTELEWLTADQAKALEPELQCVRVLSSPTTGIVDSHQYMLSLQGEIESHGGAVALKSPLLAAETHAEGFSVQVGGEAPTELSARWLVNAAGLEAQTVALQIAGVGRQHIPQRYLCKGNYFTLVGAAPFGRLIYPVPGAASLGCHYTLDLGGQGRFGPDVEWVDEINYAVDPHRAADFYDQIRRYWPALKDGALSASYAGVRPKLQSPGGETVDFRIDGPAVHGVPGLVNLFGIESPGLTSSLAIGEYVSQVLACP
ncbi:MAG: hypothetical protein RL357_1229 [Pseudomonadota bacterium]